MTRPTAQDDADLLQCETDAITKKQHGSQLTGCIRLLCVSTEYFLQEFCVVPAIWQRGLNAISGKQGLRKRLIKYIPSLFLKFLGGFSKKYEGWNFNSGNYLFTTYTK